jgi:hypothetical protein
MQGSRDGDRYSFFAWYFYAADLPTYPASFCKLRDIAIFTVTVGSCSSATACFVQLLFKLSRKHPMKTSMAAILTGVVLATSFATPAFAQKGSRLCGWWAATPGGSIGLLYEARDKDASYSAQCNGVIDEIDKKIKANADLSKLTWNRVYKNTCESIGENFVSAGNPNNDMCDYMRAKTPYQVQQSKKDNTTTYTQL